MKEILKQAFKFFVVSGLGWIVDMIIYIILTNIGLPIVISNIISASIAATYVYFVSTNKIFENSGKYSLTLKYLIYILYQFCLIFVSSYVIMYISNGLSNLFETYNLIFLLKNVKIISKIINTPVTMFVNFVVMKNLIEKL